jgi:hypothetical protein
LNTLSDSPAPVQSDAPALPIRGFKFLQCDLSSASGSEGPWVIGQARSIPARRELRLCEVGYHCSPTWRAALGYAPRDRVAALVDASDDGAATAEDGDKRVSRSMRVVAVATAEATRMALITWACDCAERALLRGRERRREPHADSWAAIETTRTYVRGECSLEAVRVARSAARRVAAADAAAAAAAAYAAYAAADAAADAAYAADAYAAADAADAAAYAAYAAADADAAAYAADAADAATRHAEREWQAGRLAELLDAAIAANGGAL